MKILIALAALIAAVSCTVTGGEREHDLTDLLHKVTEKYHGAPGIDRLRRRSTAEFHVSFIKPSDIFTWFFKPFIRYLLILLVF